MASFNEILSVHQTIRDYVKHEDNLTSERISRTLLAHGFLIASYALLLQSRIGAISQCQGRDVGCIPRSAAALASPEKYGKPSAEAVAALMPPEQLMGFLALADAILLVISLIGVFTTMAALRGVRAAERSIQSLKERWNEYSEAYFRELQGSILQIAFPPVTGGGDQAVNSSYKNVTRQFLWILLVMWMIIATATAYAWFLWNKAAISASLAFISR